MRPLTSTHDEHDAAATQESARSTQPDTADTTFSALSLEQRRAKRKEALIKMRELWNNSQARANRPEGEDGVAYQKRMRAEWD